MSKQITNFNGKLETIKDNEMKPLEKHNILN